MLDRLPGYDNWKPTVPPEAKNVATCAECGGEICEGDEIYEIDGEAVQRKTQYVC
ncbi:MAG: hypothetical protein PHV61_10445 [Limnochordia bacterium]|jgi:hypothetical protein|nr:hypothetical protein [Limnochordia bacterium]MDD4517565.1 hypothetical protein [Limnochordia bacterium]